MPEFLFARPSRQARPSKTAIEGELGQPVNYTVDAVSGDAAVTGSLPYDVGATTIGAT